MAPSETDVVEVDLGGRTVTVPRGGLFDRYATPPAAPAA